MEPETRYNIIMKDYKNALAFAVDLAQICVEANGEWKTSMRTAVFMLAFIYDINYSAIYRDIEENMNG